MGAADEGGAQARQRAFGDRLLRDQLDDPDGFGASADLERLRRSAEAKAARRVGGPLGHEDVPGFSRGFYARRDVDGVAGDDPLVRLRVVDRQHRAGVDADAHLDRDPVALGEPLVERAELGAHPQRCPERARRVVLMHPRDAEDRHHGVADELVDDPTLGLDLGPHRGKERGHHVLELLSVESLADRGGAGHIGEQHRDDLALLGCRGGDRKCVTAGAAEAGILGVLAAAIRADDGHGRSLRSERYASSIASVKTARAESPGATTRSPSWLRSASTGAVIGSKQMTGAPGGANTCANG